MAITFVGAGAVQIPGTTTATVPVPAGYAAGDILIIVTANANALATTPSGWTAQVTSSQTQNYLSIFTKTATASESSVSITCSGGLNSNSVSVMLAYRGSTGYQGKGTFQNTQGQSFSTSTFATTVANSLVMSVYLANKGFNQTWTAPASTTTRVNQADANATNGLLIVDEIKVTAGTTTARTATLSSSSTFTIYGAIALTPKPTSTGFFLMF